jgi:hypothetical protein
VIEPRELDQSLSQPDSDNIDTDTGVIKIHIPASGGVYEEYLATDKEWYDFSFKRTIIHELIHVTDPARDYAIEKARFC